MSSIEKGEGKGALPFFGSITGDVVSELCYAKCTVLSVNLEESSLFHLVFSITLWQPDNHDWNSGTPENPADCITKHGILQY